MTERGEFRFTVKEAADGRPWIAAEPAGKSLVTLPGLLAFELSPGTPMITQRPLLFHDLHIAGIGYTEIKVSHCLQPETIT